MAEDLKEVEISFAPRKFLEGHWVGPGPENDLAVGARVEKCPRNAAQAAHSRQNQRGPEMPVLSTRGGGRSEIRVGASLQKSQHKLQRPRLHRREKRAHAAAGHVASRCIGRPFGRKGVVWVRPILEQKLNALEHSLAPWPSALRRRVMVAWLRPGLNREIERSGVDRWEGACRHKASEQAALGLALGLGPAALAPAPLARRVGRLLLWRLLLWGQALPHLVGRHGRAAGPLGRRPGDLDFDRASRPASQALRQPDSAPAATPVRALGVLNGEVEVLLGQRVERQDLGPAHLGRLESRGGAALLPPQKAGRLEASLGAEHQGQAHVRVLHRRGERLHLEAVSKELLGLVEVTLAPGPPHRQVVQDSCLEGLVLVLVQEEAPHRSHQCEDGAEVRELLGLVRLAQLL
mmetsp:Transcript_39443/g.88223  ORF Transcript_39443/g.88223 Transcript_39443/m.88223 type:complete len:406 (-) Transcript_39443:81-1298(-)